MVSVAAARTDDWLVSLDEAAACVVETRPAPPLVAAPSRPVLRAVLATALVLSQPGPEAQPRSWSLPVPEDAYAQIPCWWGREHWFDSLMDALATATGENIRTKWKVKAGTLLAIAAAYRQYANPHTGRGVTVAHDTLAALVDRSAKTVQRATRALEELGFAVTLAYGRNILSADEKAQAMATHGGRQTAAANVVALTVPAPSHPVDNPAPAGAPAEQNVHLITPPPVHNPPCDIPKRQTRASAHSEAPPGPQPDATRVEVERAGERCEGGREFGVHRYLAELDRYYDNTLGDGHHIGQLDRLLRRAGVDITLWSVRELTSRIDTVYPDSHDRLLAAADALRYFGWMIRHAITPGETPPTTLGREQQERDTERARDADARRVEAARIAAIKQDEVTQIKTNSDTQLHGRRRDHDLVTTHLLGPGRRPEDFPAHTQQLYQRVIGMHHQLTRRGWILNYAELDTRLEWAWPASYLADVDDECWDATTISFTPPQQLPADHVFTIGYAGQAWDTERQVTDIELDVISIAP